METPSDALVCVLRKLRIGHDSSFRGPFRMLAAGHKLSSVLAQPS